jgi:hypothetical protein
LLLYSEPAPIGALAPSRRLEVDAAEWWRPTKIKG